MAGHQLFSGVVARSPSRGIASARSTRQVRPGESTSLKPACRPHREPVLPQRLTSLRPLITPYAEVGAERR